MKVLIITYYWPPAGGSGVQRWLKFVKYLRDFGCEPLVYCPKNPSYPIIDESLLKEIPEGIEIITGNIFEPNQFFNSNKKQVSGGFLKSKPNALNQFLQYMRANYFIPDARKYWVKPSIGFLTKYVSKNSIDLVITTGPPHSVHLIGLGLQKKTKIKWIADFRDPWMDIDYFHQLPLTNRSLRLHQKLESEVVSNSDEVVVVGKSMKDNFLKYNSNISVIPNGFDDIVFPEKIELDKKFSLVHVGLMNADRNPIVLWNALEELIVEIKNFKNDLEIKLIGTLSEEVNKSLSRFEKGLVKKISYLSHNEVRKHQFTSQILLLAINKVPSSKGIITGKIFEYLQANRPILAIGPENGDAAEILKNTKAGVCIDFEDKNAVKNHILALYKEFKKGELKVDSQNINLYHRKELTKKLAVLIKDKITS